MIVADTNVLAYLLLPGDFTEQAEAIYAWDADWHVPSLWLSEFRNVLTLYVRQGQLTTEEAHTVLADAITLIGGREHSTRGLPVVDRALETGCSAYDAEFLTLAEHLGCPLMTADRRLVQRAPGTARLLADVAASL